MTRAPSVGFAPVARSDARNLVLGTLPGPVSLEKQQYYAQPRNAFWSIMGALFGANPELTYSDRLQILKANRVALWDVCACAEREGALDEAIRDTSVVANDFATFFSSDPQIQLICFNGQTAAKLYRRHVLPVLPEAFQGIRRETLPSTSPAHAAMRFDEKLERWSIVRSE